MNMKNAMRGLLLVSGLALSAGVNARETLFQYDVAGALQRARALELPVASDISLYFSGQSLPEGAHVLKPITLFRKAQSLSKTDREACDTAFLGAVREMQEQARLAGAQAIGNIRSNYDNYEENLKSEYRCGAGFLMAGVAFKADLLVMTPIAKNLPAAVPVMTVPATPVQEDAQPIPLSQYAQ